MITKTAPPVYIIFSAFSGEGFPLIASTPSKVNWPPSRTGMGSKFITAKLMAFYLHEIAFWQSKVVKILM